MIHCSTDSNLVLDCIIFGLQGNGGISSYWARLLESYLTNLPNRPELVLPRHIQSRDFREEWNSHFRVQRELIPHFLSRYFVNPNCGKGDVFHTSYYRLPARKPKNYVVTAYDFIYERYQKGPARTIHTLQKRRSLERADTIACISKFTRDDVLMFMPHIDPARLHIVPLGVDINTFYPDVQLADASLRHTVLFVGQRGGYKRFDLAVRALCISDVRFVLGIVGPPLSRYENTILNTSLKERWNYFGAVSSVRLRQLYSSAYALIFPSDCEGFGLPMLEAMACNCPVVAAGRTSLLEVGGEAALYAREQRADDYSAALELLRNGSIYDKVITDGAARVAKFSWTETSKKTISLYNLAY
jgi:mannosyltransferase